MDGLFAWLRELIADASQMPPHEIAEDLAQLWFKQSAKLRAEDMEVKGDKIITPTDRLVNEAIDGLNDELWMAGMALVHNDQDNKPSTLRTFENDAGSLATNGTSATNVQAAVLAAALRDAENTPAHDSSSQAAQPEESTPADGTASAGEGS